MKVFFFFQKYLLMKIVLYIFVSFVVGGMFFQMGNDASKTLFNLGFCFVTLIALLYFPMMPVLLQCKYQLEKIIFWPFLARPECKLNSALLWIRRSWKIDNFFFSSFGGSTSEERIFQSMVRSHLLFFCHVLFPTSFAAHSSQHLRHHLLHSD